MKLKKFNDLSVPLFNKWKNYNYNNFERRSTIDTLLNKKKLIVKFKGVVNEMFLDALINYDNLNVSIFYGISNLKLFEFIANNLGEYTTLYGIKEVTLNHKQLQAFFYQLYYEDKFIKFRKMKDIDEYITKKIGNRKVYKFNIAIFKNKNGYDVNPILKKSGMFYFYPKNRLEKIILTTMIFNHKSLEMMSKIDLEGFMRKFKNSKVFFLKYRKMLFEKIKHQDHHKFMLFSSINLYLLGLREMSDLDVYVDILENVETKNALDKVMNIKKDNDYIDFSIKGTELWKPYWNVWLKEWARLCGTFSFNNILVDTQFHYYWCGVKIISMECDIQRRIARNRPRAYGDLIMLKRGGLYNFRLPTPNFIKKEFKLVRDIEENELNEMLRGEWKYKDNKQIEIFKEEKIDRTRFISTIKWWLKEKYQFEVTVNDVKDILNIRPEKKINKLKQEKIEFKKKMLKIKKRIVGDYF